MPARTYVREPSAHRPITPSIADGAGRPQRLLTMLQGFCYAPFAYRYLRAAPRRTEKNLEKKSSEPIDAGSAASYRRDTTPGGIVMLRGWSWRYSERYAELYEGGTQRGAQGRAYCGDGCPRCSDQLTHRLTIESLGVQVLQCNTCGRRYHEVAEA